MSHIIRWDRESSKFYSEYFNIRVNNRASKTIYKQKFCFIINFHPFPHQYTKGISGQIFIKDQGIVWWNIEYDEGRVHTLKIKDALYVPESPIYIIFPQHWDHQAKDNFLAWRGTYIENLMMNVSSTVTKYGTSFQ